jgi:hypothetical protein
MQVAVFIALILRQAGWEGVTGLLNLGVGRLDLVIGSVLPKFGITPASPFQERRLLPWRQIAHCAEDLFELVFLVG